MRLTEALQTWAIKTVKAREKLSVRREVFRTMQRANEQTGLVKLGDSDLVLEDQTQDGEKER